MPDHRPNILFIFPDQWRADAFSALGHPVVLTPYCDELIASGTRFTTAISNCPLCIPARACLMTGRTPHGVGRFGWRDHATFEHHRPALAECLRDAGYQTMLAGKTHFYPRRLHLGFEQLRLCDNALDYANDYDRWLAVHSQGRLRPALDVLHGNSLVTEPWTHDESLHATNWTTEAALELLDKRDPTRPFFLNLAYHRPHPPFDPPLEHWDRYKEAPLPAPPVGDWAARFDRPTAKTDAIYGRFLPAQFDRIRRGYYAAISHVDAQIGRVLTWLRWHRLLDETLIVLSSDHGEQLGDHHLFRKSTPFFGSLHVPFVVKPPASWKVPAGAVCEAPVALHDLMPTLLEAAGVPIPASVEGRSVVPLLRAPQATDAWRSYAHAEQSDGALGSWQCLVDAQWKYVWQTVTGEEFLFDRTADPAETRNLAADPAFAAALGRWRSRLAADLAPRTEDGFSDGMNLLPGRRTPALRDPA